MTNGALIQLPSFCFYGPSGIGKSAMAIQALDPRRTLWISCEPGALQPAHDRKMNPHWPAWPIERFCLSASAPQQEMVAHLGEAVRLAKKGAIDAVVIDPVSDYLARLEYLARTVGIGDRGPERREYGRAAGEVDDQIRPYLWQLHDALRSVERPREGTRGVILVLIGHQKDPVTIDGRSTRGGLATPGRIGHHLRYLFDVVLRCGFRIVDGREQPMFCHDRADDDRYPTKDRFNIVSDRARDGLGLTPMDFDALLRTILRKQMGEEPLAEDAVRLWLGGKGRGAGAARGVGMEAL